jgi:competence protein ComEA
MAHRAALLLVVLAALAAAPVRVFLETPDPPRRCTSEGRGTAPRHWLGCAADPGVPRPLAGDERLILGLPLDVNRATARELAFVPGLGRHLAAALVDERARNGPFATVDEVVRVRGIGPKKLEKARPAITVIP